MRVLWSEGVSNNGRCSCSQLSKPERVSVLFCRHCIHSFVSVSLADCHCTSVPFLGPCGLQAMRSCFGGKGPDDGSVGIAVCNLRNCSDRWFNPREYIYQASPRWCIQMPTLSLGLYNEMGSQLSRDVLYDAGHQLGTSVCRA